MHREYGFTAGEVLSMSEDDCVFWLSTLDSEEGSASGDTWENADE